MTTKQKSGVCIHGGLRRQCEACDLADQVEVAESRCRALEKALEVKNLTLDKFFAAFFCGVLIFLLYLGSHSGLRVGSVYYVRDDSFAALVGTHGNAAAKFRIFGLTKRYAIYTCPDAPKFILYVPKKSLRPDLHIGDYLQCDGPGRYPCQSLLLFKLTREIPNLDDVVTGLVMEPVIIR